MLLVTSNWKLKMATVTINSRSRSIKGFSDDVTSFSVGALADKIAARSKLNSNRIRLTYKRENSQVPLDTSKSLTDYFGPQELLGGIEIFAKDLGPQIGYQTVFILEYLGPIAIQALIHTYFVHIKGVPQTQTQNLAYYLVVLHFLKRELETLFVHRFSNATMPLFNLFKNSVHYWILSGFNLAYFTYSQDAFQLAAAGPVKKFFYHVNSYPPFVNYALVGLWLFAQTSNLITHIKLAGLRTTDSKAYVIPKGYGFDLLVCPNYFFESLGWFTFSLLVGNWSSWVFFEVGTGQMYIWAVARRKKYLKTFGDDFKKLKRAVYIPYLW